MTEKWIRDTGLVAILLALYFAYHGSHKALGIALLLTLITLLVPSLLRPLAYVWLKLTEVLGMVMPRVFFGLVFFVVVTPIGLIRRLLSGDPRAKKHNTEDETALVAMKGLVTKEDLAHPY